MQVAPILFIARLLRIVNDQSDASVQNEVCQSNKTPLYYFLA